MRSFVSRLALIALTAGLLAGAARPAAALSYTDLEGKWCGSASIYTFTRDQLVVSFYDRTPTRRFEVTGYEFTDDSATVNWLRDGKEMYTTFVDFSADRSRMNQEAQTTCDRGPQRAFRRC